MLYRMAMIFVDAFQRRWLWLPPLVYASAIFYLSSLSYPEEVIPQGKALFETFGDRWMHFIEYAFLTVLCYPALRYSSGPQIAPHAVVSAILVASLYGITDEVHQAFVPFREASWLDLAADMAGAMIAALSIHIIPSTPCRTFGKTWTTLADTRNKGLW
jgi:VanZ family protein